MMAKRIQLLCLVAILPLLLTGCVMGNFASIGHMQYKMLNIEEKAGQVFSQEIGGLEVSATRRFDLTFGSYGSNILPVYISITNKSKDNYKIKEEGAEGFILPAITLAKKYDDSPIGSTDPEDYYTVAGHYLCQGLQQSIDMTKAYGADMDPNSIVKGACAKEIPFQRIIIPGSSLEGFTFFHAQALEDINEDLAAFRIELEIKNNDTGKTVTFLIPVGEGFNCMEKFAKIRGASFGPVRPLSVSPGLRKPVWTEEEITCNFPELWQKIKHSLFEMKNVRYLFADMKNKEFSFNQPLTIEELQATVSADLSKFSKRYLKEGSTSFIKLRLTETGKDTTRIAASAEIMLGWYRFNSNGKLEKDFLDRLTPLLGVKKYEWLEK